MNKLQEIGALLVVLLFIAVGTIGLDAYLHSVFWLIISLSLAIYLYLVGWH